MYSGDKKRKTTLVDHGFRLPSALENRPLQFDEFRNTTKQTIYVSATPSDFELEMSEGVFVEQIIRPTGLLDPEISVRPIATQIDDLVGEIRIRIMKNERVLVTTLTKKMSEDLSDYLFNLDIKVSYIHSDIDSLERVEIIRDFRLGEYDVLVGVNLLREGLDMPEVSLVAILDADKEGFLRSASALLQTAGRTARNVNGLVILYADRVTKAMKVLIDETNRRRKLQTEYNTKHGINPKTIYKSLEEILESTSVADVQKARKGRMAVKENLKQIAAEPTIEYMSEDQKEDLLNQMFQEMKKAAQNLDFERAANLRDEIARIKADEAVNS
jgi:excinuclease ABC subunit B